jgi:plastocyanin
MSSDQVRRPLGRRSLLGVFGGAGALTTLWDQNSRGGPALEVAAQGTPTPEWTPPPIPQPLPKPGGTPPPLVGAAPAAAPPSSAQNPAASGTPGAVASPISESAAAPYTNPGAPPQPVASPAATSAAAAPAPSATVELTPDFKFSPDKVSIKTGQSVRWVNKGKSPQTVTCDPARATDKSVVQLPSGAQPWDSGVLNSGDDFVHAFDTAGTYRYFSMPQEKTMTGQVEVTS